jgi:hypothetical protein
MAADEASAKEETAEPLITRVVRAVTQPGGMDIDCLEDKYVVTARPPESK